MMNQQTIVAVYDTAARAEAAVRDLEAASVPADAISQHAKTGGTTGTATASHTHEQGFWSKLFGTEPEYDTQAYDRSIERGAIVVTVKSSEEQYDRIAAILEKHDPINLDDDHGGLHGGTTETTTTRTTNTAGVAGATATGAALGARGTENDTALGVRGTANDTALGARGTTTGAAGTGLGARGTGNETALGARGTATGDEKMQLSEESLQVGKRATQGGTARIRKYVVNTPVEEQVSLHSEKVTVDRHPVNDGRPVGDGSFRDQTIEMTERGEEAVVSKTARVKEEIGLHREGSDRTETVKDNVRREEAEVEQAAGGRQGAVGNDATRTGTETTRTAGPAETTPAQPRPKI